MKAYNLALRFFAFTLCTIVPAYAQLDDWDGRVPTHLAEALDGPPEDPSAAEAWKSRVRESKGITPDLLAFMWKSLEAGPPENVGLALRALRFRVDLDAQSIQRIKAHLIKIVEVGVPSRDSADFAFMLGAIVPIAIHDRSPDLEHLLLRFLEDANERSNWRFFDTEVLEALRLLGRAESLQAIDSHVNRRWGSRASQVLGYKDFAKTVDVIKLRLAAHAETGDPSLHSTAPQTKQSSRSTGSITQQAALIKDSIHWSLWAVMVAAATGLLWLFVKRRV